MCMFHLLSRLYHFPSVACTMCFYALKSLHNDWLWNRIFERRSPNRCENWSSKPIALQLSLSYLQSWGSLLHIALLDWIESIETMAKNGLTQNRKQISDKYFFNYLISLSAMIALIHIINATITTLLANFLPSAGTELLVSVKFILWCQSYVS